MSVVETTAGRIQRLFGLLSPGPTGAFSLALSLHAVAVATVILSFRSSVDLLAEVELAGMAGSTLAILGALILTPMKWRFRIALAAAVLAGVLAGAIVIRECEAFENPWPNRLPLGVDWGSSAISNVNSTTFFWTACIAIAGTALLLQAGSAVAKSTLGILHKRLKTRTIVLLCAALLLLVLSRYQSFVMNGGMIFQSAVAQTVLLACGAVVFVLAPTMILFWSRSGLWAGLGAFLVLLNGSVSMVLTSSWFSGHASRPPVAHMILLTACLALFAGFLITVGCLLRFLTAHPDRESNRPHRITFWIAVAPAIVLVIAAWQFSTYWDSGILVRSQDWKLASALAKGRNSGVCMDYSPFYSLVSVADSADSDCLDELFRQLPETQAGPYRQVYLHGLRPGIGLGSIGGMSPLFVGAAPTWIIDRCSLDGKQLTSLCQPGNSVVIMEGIQFGSDFRDVVLNGTLHLHFDNDALERILNRVDLENSSCGIHFNFVCNDDEDLALLIRILELLSRSRGVNECHCRVSVPESGDSRLKGLAKAEIDWSKTHLSVGGGYCPLEVIQKILVTAAPKSQVPLRFNKNRPEELGKGLRLVLAYADSFIFGRYGPGDDLTALDDLESLTGIGDFGCVMESENGLGSAGLIALRRKWLDVLSDQETQSIECLVLGGTPLGDLEFWSAEDYESVSGTLSRFTQVRDLQCDHFCFRDFGFLREMPELRSLRLAVYESPVFAGAIEDHLPALAKLERLVLIGRPSPEILAAVKTLPSLKSLTILSGIVEVDPEESRKIGEMLPDLDVKVVPATRFLEFEPEILKSHRQRLREQFKRETEGK